MENVSEVCTSAFFSLPKEENVDLFNSEFDYELFKLCEEIEKSEMFDSIYDDALYDHCAMVETQFNQPLQLGKGIKRTRNDQEVIKKVRTEEEASTSSGTSGSDRGTEEETSISAGTSGEKKCEPFDSLYDEELYDHCAMVEIQFNQPLQLGKGMKKTTNDQEVIKEARTEEEASICAGTSGGHR